LKDFTEGSKIFTSIDKFQKPVLDKFKSYLDKTSFLNTSVYYTGSINSPDSKKKLNEIKIKIKQAEVLIETTKNEIHHLNQREVELKGEMAGLRYGLAIEKKFTNSSLFFSIKVILWIAIFILILFLIYRRLGLI
jgi:hypothetical protein